MANKFLNYDGLSHFWSKIKTLLGGKVDKVEGKGLSTNDLTDELLSKLNGVEEGANKTVVENVLTSDSTTNALSAAQGKALDAKIAAINTDLENKGAGDMLKSVYDIDGDGVVDKATDADKLGGAVAADYAKKADVATDIGNALTEAKGYTDTLANGAVANNTSAINAIKDGTSIDSFKDVEEALAGKQATGDYATKTEAQGYADAKDSAIAEAKKAGTDAQAYAEGVAGDLAEEVERAKGAEQANATAAANAQSAADKAQGEVDALETVVEGKADKATTLAGYGITNAYTSAETDSAIATAVANAEHLKRSIVEALPEVSAADAHTIYMVKADEDSSDNKYIEYMVINGAWEKTGDTDVDLTDYMKTADMEAITTDEIDTMMA